MRLQRNFWGNSNDGIRRNPTESDGTAKVFSFLCNSHVRSRSVRGSIDSKWIPYRLWVEKAWHIFWKSTWRSLNRDFFEKNWFQAVGSQVSSSPTALAAQVVTVVSLAAAGAFPCDQDVIRPKVSMISLLPQIISVWCHAIGVWVKAWGTFQESFYNAAFVDFETFVNMFEQIILLAVLSSASSANFSLSSGRFGKYTAGSEWREASYQLHSNQSNHGHSCEKQGS